MSTSEINTIVVIPARGGSKGIPRKNLRFLAGRPLISYVIENSKKSKYIDTVVVSTDDHEISYIAEKYGAEIIHRPAEMAGDDVPLDPVIYHAVIEKERLEGIVYDVVITIQPTSPLLSTATIDAAIEIFLEKEADTLLSVVDDRHLSWTKQNDRFIPNYSTRKNRQYLPSNFRETGGIVIARKSVVTEKSRFGNKVEVIEVAKSEALDIDDEMDWWVAEKLLCRKKILIRVEGYKEIGLGHIYRMLLLANRLIDHELLFVLHDGADMGIRLIAAYNYRLKTFRDSDGLAAILREYSPDIVINDILDTSAEYILTLKEQRVFVVNFEDLGTGAQYADIVINALYSEKYPSHNHYWGKDYYCLRDEFYLTKPKEIAPMVRNILISFGGTDSNDYTRRVFRILKRLSLENLKIVVIAGLGYGYMELLQEEAREVAQEVQILQDIHYISKYMSEADVAVTSGGRTVYELASLGVPTIVLAQNEREMRHTFACIDNGVINLGLGYTLSDAEIEEALLRVYKDAALRGRCQKLMKRHDLKTGTDRVLTLIFSEYEKGRSNHNGNI